MKRSVFLLFSFLFITELQAQDPPVSQFFLNKLYLNPAYAGINRDANVWLTNRSQWTYVPGRFRTTFATADVGCPDMNLGYGIILYDNVEGEGFLRSTFGHGVLAVHVPFSKNLVGSLGMKFGMGYKRIDWDKLYFSDEIDPIHGFVYPTAATPEPIHSDLILDAGAGAVVRYRWKNRVSFSSWGFSMDHVNRPVESILGANTRIPIRITAQTFHHFRFSGKYSTRAPAYLSAGVIYERQQQHETLVIGGAATFGDHILLGLWYRNKNYMFQGINRESMIANLTVHFDGLTLGYSYDITISNLGIDKTHGSHEITLGYFFFDRYFCAGRGKRTKRSSCYLFEVKTVSRKGFNKPKWGKHSSPWMYVLP